MEEKNENYYYSDLVEESLIKQREQLDQLEVGSEEHLRASKAITMQEAAWSEMNKIELEFSDRAAQREEERASRIEQLKASDRAQTKGLIITGLFSFAERATSLMSYNHWFNKGLKFETDGTITSSTMKNLTSSTLRPDRIK